MKRKQFTFYESFYRAIRRIRRKTVRCDLYDAICAYALEGKAPDLEALPNEAALAMLLILPILERAGKRAEGGAQSPNSTTSPPQAHHKSFNGLVHNCNNKKENEKEIEIEIETETETEYEGEAVEACVSKERDFELFWEAYPRKAGKEKAKAAFFGVQVEVQVLLEALGEQKKSGQWQAGEGRYIPYPATWLAEKRWEDQLAPAGGVPYGASGKLGAEELAAIQRAIQENG